MFYNFIDWMVYTLYHQFYITNFIIDL